MKTNNKIFKVPLETILNDKWFMFMNTSAVFIGGDDIRKYKAHQKLVRCLVRYIVLAGVSLILLWILFGVMVGNTVAKESSHPIYKYAPIFKGGSERQQKIVNYAWHISQDPNWVATLYAENGTFEENRIGITNDRGLCQLNPNYHWSFIVSPEFQDYRIQLLYCAEVYKRASERGILYKIFFGWNNRERAKSAFIWQ